MRRPLTTPLVSTPVALGDLGHIVGLETVLSKDGKPDILLWYEKGEARMLLRIGEEGPEIFISFNEDRNPTAISELPEGGPQGGNTS